MRKARKGGIIGRMGVMRNVGHSLIIIVSVLEVYYPVIAFDEIAVTLAAGLVTIAFDKL